MTHPANSDFSRLALDDLLSEADDDIVVTAAEKPLRPCSRVAIVGMAGKVAGCEDLDAFWELLRDGRMARRALPEAREADVKEFLRLKGARLSASPARFFRESFLAEVDKFDHRFFGIARQEANFTDPNQRLFLETAWAALEHAGYGGESIKGSATGVFVGFSGDFGDSYRDIMRALAPDASEVAVAGNVKSIIASRIAYQLDLRGPSMMIDTACSSGLVAVHLACRALLAGECEMAIAGAVKLDLIPVAEDPEIGAGIKDIQDTISSDGRTKTFDDDCEGTAGAEGVLAFVLKPFERAVADGDTIHAVILGSAVNQDGKSVGITAPNLEAQENLIAAALEKAGVHPEDISYVEAHGTATKLGDPIEIGGIQRAFRRLTDRRQFCAVGSVKTNIGHLDNAAGLASLAKVVLSMRHGQLPPSLNFQKPNRNIAFEHSPVFINDVLRPWRSDDGSPLCAGINSFGLSGTNCHVVVASAPPAMAKAHGVPGGELPYLLAVSACTEQALMSLSAAYLRQLCAAPVAPEDLCFTAALGRRHHPYRLAFLFRDIGHLLSQLDGVVAKGGFSDIEGVAYGSFRVASGTRSEQNQLDRQAAELTAAYLRAGLETRRPMIAQAQALYVQGADVEWRHWFGDARRIPLPTYPFARTRCWIETTAMAQRAAKRGKGKQIAHPLLDHVSVTRGLRLYETTLSADSHWELADHKVKGRYVLPGTALVEMVLEAAANMNGGRLKPLQVEQLIFMRPVVLTGGQGKTVQVLVSEVEHGYKIEIVSLADPDSPEWDVHAEAVLRMGGAALPAPVDLGQLKASLPETLPFARSDDVSRGLEIGDRWNLSFRCGWTNAGRDAFLAHLALPEQYRTEVALYHFHPALLDTAVNAANHLVGDGGLYLPFSYKRLEVFRRLPEECYVHLRKKPGASVETFQFDIDLLDAQGGVCARINDYTVKLVREAELAGELPAPRMHAVKLVPVDEAGQGHALAPDLPVLLVRQADHGAAECADALMQAGVEVIELIGTDADGYRRAFEGLVKRQFAGVIYAASLGNDAEDGEPAESLNDFADFIAGFVDQKCRCSGSILVLTPGAFAAGQDVDVDPGMAALAALARTARLEYPQLRFRCLDADLPLAGDRLLRHLADAGDDDLAVYRGPVRYRERLESLPNPEPACFMPRKEGVYLVTGGTGALGLELACHLARRGQINLALVSSTPLPPSLAWETLIEAAGTERKLRARLERLLSLEKSGAKVKCIAADAGDFAAMREVVESLKAEYGAINGIVHAAGRAGEGFLHTKERRRFNQVLAPKMNGAWALHVLTKDDPLDFFVMYSSIATVLRNPGQTDYTAANAYLDALARHRRGRGLTAVSVCWPAWRETGIAVEYGAVDENEFFAPVGTVEALQAAEQVLCGSDLPPVLIAAKANPRATLDQLEALGLEPADDIRKLFKPSAHGRTGARGGETEGGAHVAVQGIDNNDQVVQAVARIWGRVLGVIEIGADDAFADHGGNSILVTQLYREFDKVYPGAIEVADLFTHTTIRDQAAFIRKSLGVLSPSVAAPEDKPDMDRILAMLAEGSISAEEAESILSA